MGERIKDKTEITAGMKALGIIMGASLGGMMWRFRGTHGYGGSWGLIAVGTALALLIYAFYGKRIKHGFKLLPVLAISAGLTVTGWGACNSLLSGSISSIAAFPDGAEKVLPFGQGSALAVMLLMGFGLSCLFGTFCGTLFSDRGYKAYHYLIYIAVFFAVSYIFKATLSHALIKVIAPQAVEYFKDGIAAAGKSGSPWKVYMSHFDNIPWGKKIPFGRCYFEIIEHISHSAGALALVVTALAVFKDKITAAVSLAFDFVCAFAITAADFFNVSGTGAGVIAKIPKLRPFTENSWSTWEFFTGFFIGLGLMLILAFASKTSVNKESQTSGKKAGAKTRLFGAFTAFTYLFAAVPMRAAALHITDFLEESGVIKDESPFDIIGTVLLSVTAAAFIFRVLKKKIYNTADGSVESVSLDAFAKKALFCYVLFAAVTFFLLPTGYLWELPWGRGFFEKMISPGYFWNVLTSAAFAVWALVCGCAFGRKSEKRGRQNRTDN